MAQKKLMTDYLEKVIYIQLIIIPKVHSNEQE